MRQQDVERQVRRAQQGDARAFERLYDAFYDRVYGFVRSRVPDVETAKDLAATVFIRAWEALPSYDIRGVPFAAWLFRIARNAIIGLLGVTVPEEYGCAGANYVSYGLVAREVERVSEDDAAMVADAGAVDEAVIARCDAEAVRRAVRRLTDEQAAVIVLRFFWDMPVADVAKALGKTEGAVKAMQHRAVRMLARLLSEEADGRLE